MGPKLRDKDGATDNYLGPNAYYPEDKLTKQKMTRDITMWLKVIF